ncbi:MAG: PAS domain S-box protein [Actinobacteria bacterium]|nr:PAS domain S-box protein [Actinomycetota bacterium]
MESPLSAPVTAERAGWQSRRVLQLSTGAYTYGAAVVAAATIATAAAIVFTGDSPDATDWVAFVVLAPAAALALLFRISIGRNHGFHAAPAFVVAGALALPPQLLVTLVVITYIPAWATRRAPWYIQIFNTANYGLAALAALATARLLGGGVDHTVAIASLSAAAVFVVANHLLLALMLRLARGHSFRETGLFGPLSLGVDLVLASLGAAIVLFLDTNPWLLPTLVAPLVLAHRSLSTVALLRKSEERFRAMFESAATATLLVDRDGSIMATNRAAEDLFGLSQEQLVGLPQRRLVHPDERPSGEFAALMGGERDHYRTERRLVDADGDTIWGQLAVSLVRDADAKPEFAIAMIEDVTEQKELEERLRQSQKLEAIGRLAGGVAHDFNNMLTAIGGYNALALEHAPKGTPLHGDLDEIRKATDRAALLTRQLLAFSRKQILQPELLNLNGIVVEIQSMLRPLIGEDVILTTELDPALGPIEADPGQLQQVLMNLVVNARDAMPGGGRLSIETANADVAEGDPAIAPGRYVTLVVRDSGHGIDAETLEQIFEPFFTTKESGKGTGLGLATVYGIVKQSGGYVAVESELGEGTAFTIYLRRADEARTTRPEEPPEPAAEVVSHAAATVLVVEDEEVVRRLVSQVLEQAGYRVLVAADGEEAMVLAGSHAIHVLLTDMRMPGQSGREVADRLRASRPALKVIYMSGYADGNAFEQGVEVLEKPFTFDVLTEKVARVLDTA